MEAAQDVVEARLNEEVRRLGSMRNVRYEAEKARIEKYCDYRQTEGLRKLRHHEEILARLRASDRDEDRRVIPIWERNLENDVAYLTSIDHDRDRLNTELVEGLDVSYNYELLNVAWIEVIESWQPSR